MRANRLYAIAVTLGLLITVSSAWAGPNAGGTLIVHHSGYAERYSQPSDCSGVTLANCGDAVTTTPDMGYFYHWPIWYVVAAFPEGSSPRLSAVTFGASVGDGVSIYNSFSCGDAEVWDGLGAIQVRWNTPQTGLLVPVYCFYGYAYYATDQFCLGPHSSRGGTFLDDSVVPQVDPIEDYGCLGFGNHPGYLPCPDSAASDVTEPGNPPSWVHSASWGWIKDRLR